MQQGIWGRIPLQKEDVDIKRYLSSVFDRAGNRAERELIEAVW